MKYLLLYNIDELSKNILLKSYIDEGFEVILDSNNCILIRKDKDNLKDEDIYIKILLSFLKRSSMIKYSKGKVIDLTEAFKYAHSKDGFDKFDNNFDWYIRNIIIKELNI